MTLCAYCHVEEHGQVGGDVGAQTEASPKRRETLGRIDELTLTLIQVWAVHTQRQADAVRRLAVETWLQRNGVITITQNKKVLPVFREQFAHN